MLIPRASEQLQVDRRILDLIEGDEHLMVGIHDKDYVFNFFKRKVGTLMDFSPRYSFVNINKSFAKRIETLYKKSIEDENLKGTYNIERVSELLEISIIKSFTSLLEDTVSIDDLVESGKKEGVETISLNFLYSRYRLPTLSLLAKELRGIKWNMTYDRHSVKGSGDTVYVLKFNEQDNQGRNLTKIGITDSSSKTNRIESIEKELKESSKVTLYKTKENQATHTESILHGMFEQAPTQKCSGGSEFRWMSNADMEILDETVKYINIVDSEVYDI